VRLFFAVELPPEVQATLGRLRPSDDNRDYRWVDASLLHVTLAFLGEQPEERLETLKSVGREAAAHSHVAVLRLGAAGHFGSGRAPRVLWVDLAGDVAALSTLHANLTHSLKAAAFPTEDRPFTAHITLARRRETARGGRPAGWPPHVTPSPFDMDTLTLMQSRLSPRGPTYTPVYQASIAS
jgi:2'-5' RNA ligase